MKKKILFSDLSIGQIQKKTFFLLKNVQKSHFKLRVLDAIILFGYIKLTNPIENIPIIYISGGPPAVTRKKGRSISDSEEYYDVMIKNQKRVVSLGQKKKVGLTKRKGIYKIGSIVSIANSILKIDLDRIS